MWLSLFWLTPAFLKGRAGGILFGERCGSEPENTQISEHGTHPVGRPDHSSLLSVVGLLYDDLLPSPPRRWMPRQSLVRWCLLKGGVWVCRRLRRLLIKISKLILALHAWLLIQQARLQAALDRIG